MIRFRKLKSEDYELMYKWLNKPHVIKWYTQGSISFERVKEKYGAYLEPQSKFIPFIIMFEDVPIGYIQTYYIDKLEYYSTIVKVDNSAGIDLFIGDENYVHKGLGSKIIGAFINSEVFNMKDISCCIIGPDPENKIAIKSYEKAGFKFLKQVYNERQESDEYMMIFKKS